MWPGDTLTALGTVLNPDFTQALPAAPHSHRATLAQAVLTETRRVCVLPCCLDFPKHSYA